MKYHQTEYVSIEYLNELQVIKTKWSRNTLHEEYRDVFEKTLALAVEKKCYFWLFDQTDKTGISLNEDMDWLRDSFIPTAMEAMGGSGLRVATILSKSIFAQLSAKKVAQDNAEKIKQHVFDIAYFEHEASALAYLNAVRI